MAVNFNSVNITWLTVYTAVGEDLSQVEGFQGNAVNAGHMLK